MAPGIIYNHLAPFGTILEEEKRNKSIKLSYGTLEPRGGADSALEGIADTSQEMAYKSFCSLKVYIIVHKVV